VPLIRRFGSTKLLRGPMGGLAGSVDCCCGPVDLCADAAAYIAAFVMDSATITWVADAGCFLGRFDLSFSWPDPPGVHPTGIYATHMEWEFSTDGGTTWACTTGSPVDINATLPFVFSYSPGFCVGPIGACMFGEGEWHAPPIDVTIRARINLSCGGGVVSGWSDWLVGNTTTVPAP
jgi:hypothetical protein